jgi:eukaryotic-like serine/threonine-protein kinase
MPNDWPASNARAEVLASLNHPNIAAVYGLEQSNATAALVMALLEGPTLADGIARGAIALDEALPIAKQIAEALDAVLTTPRTT